MVLRRASRGRAAGCSGAQCRRGPRAPRGAHTFPPPPAPGRLHHHSRGVRGAPWPAWRHGRSACHGLRSAGRPGGLFFAPPACAQPQTLQPTKAAGDGPVPFALLPPAQAQRYEGGSTLYGPSTLDAYIQILTALAKAMISGTDLPSTGAPPDLLSVQFNLRPPVVADGSGPGAFGDVTQDVAAVYKAGDVASATFRCTRLVCVRVRARVCLCARARMLTCARFAVYGLVWLASKPLVAHDETPRPPPPRLLQGGPSQQQPAPRGHLPKGAAAGWLQVAGCRE
jgi:hypothetical protein